MHEAYSRFPTGSPLKGHRLETFRTGDRFRVGSIEVQPVHVDHSIPGAYGFILHTTEGAVVYTGDFRFHGHRGEMTRDFIAAAAESRPRVLISEGTRVGQGDSRKERGEKDVVAETRQLLASNKRLVFSSFRGNDLDRVSSFFKACQESGRRLVVSMKVAAVLEKLKNDRHLDVPQVGRDVSVFIRRKKGGTYDDRDYAGWEKPLLSRGTPASEIKKDQKGFLLHLDEAQLPELIDIRPDPGGAYIHATTEAFNEEGEQDEALIRNWVGHFGFSYHQVHASGHAPMSGVSGLVKRIAARSVIPVHTESPALFSPMTESLVVPRRGEAILVS